MKKTQISVATVFDGQQDGQQVFIDLILKKYRDKINDKKNVENARQIVYNGDKVFSDVRVERKEKIV